jgi:hypothetical protein
MKKLESTDNITSNDWIYVDADVNFDRFRLLFLEKNLNYSKRTFGAMPKETILDNFSVSIPEDKDPPSSARSLVDLIKGWIFGAMPKETVNDKFPPTSARSLVDLIKENKNWLLAIFYG